MAEYTSDEERFSALINFFKDNKNTLLIGLVGALIIAISFFAYNSYDANQNAEASKLYDDWFQVSILNCLMRTINSKVLIIYKTNIPILAMLCSQEW